MIDSETVVESITVRIIGTSGGRAGPSTIKDMANLAAFFGLIEVDLGESEQGRVKGEGVGEEVKDREGGEGMVRAKEVRSKEKGRGGGKEQGGSQEQKQKQEGSRNDGQEKKEEEARSARKP